MRVIPGKSFQPIKRNPDISRMIVVAIDNDGLQRMNEYSAWKYKESNIPGMQFGGQGCRVWGVCHGCRQTLYRSRISTLADREHTAMIGLQLGGNITQFLGLEYQDQIGCLGVFSSANWLHQEAFVRYIERKKLYADQRIFIYVGTEEADDTDKTLMAGSQASLYRLIPSVLPRCHSTRSGFGKYCYSDTIWGYSPRRSMG